ncbi:alpha amylase catalytic region [Coriobacterium glomerans PW2]|uniref:Alpha amylase catalytic region n=1 Tax=Coriobacterium glomerans (strain ATCC 49209 / DSM 20642 / JCM 10262 / PW2) TaxID=700015 RepID=F2NBT4_CORGP|nr:alpha,alpha-phosphotrehalase [Coriobacterium glomerans]AEB06893.1 alpha amylase catalytic region [Coriobacterium glomerans PW2]
MAEGVKDCVCCSNDACRFGDSTVYQIYVKSFKDSNGDGIGDLAGIIEKLDYLAELGIDYLWLTPFFASPLHDNGYDVSDYKAVNPLFGSMDDFDRLVEGASARGMKIMLDMVFNHTSSEHTWFQRALAGDARYQDYYIFREGVRDEPPTNWKSKFGGSAWEYVSALGRWYLHLFDVTQPDLNWDNPAVRAQLADVVRYWRRKGVSGFRFDVVNLISKPRVFIDDLKGDGRSLYTDGPRIHEYLKELVATAGIGSMITVGEMSSTSLADCMRYTDPTRHELSMIFSFHHLKVDYKDGDKWSLMRPDILRFRELIRTWQLGLQSCGGWNALFLGNHDQPRPVSRFGDDKTYWDVSAKMLAIFMHLMRGTPYVYQGEEIGMGNPGFSSIEQYRDVESLNYYRILRHRGKSEQEALAVLAQRSRDNSRTPMQWQARTQAGFTDGTPWIETSRDAARANVANEIVDPNSIWSLYRHLIELRKQMPLIARGSIAFLEVISPKVIAYVRELDSKRLVVLSSFSNAVEAAVPAGEIAGMRLLASSYPTDPETDDGIVVLRPWEGAALIR